MKKEITIKLSKTDEKILEALYDCHPRYNEDTKILTTATLEPLVNLISQTRNNTLKEFEKKEAEIAEELDSISESVNQITQEIDNITTKLQGKNNL